MPAAKKHHPDGTRPRSLGRRLGLLLALFLLPVAAVSLPTIFIGQRPPPGQGASAWAGFQALRGWWSGRSSTSANRDANGPGFDSLREALNKSAQSQLPDTDLGLPTPGEITLPAGDAAATATDARLFALTRLAGRLGGSAVEKPADAAGRHLFVTLPAAGGKRAVFEILATRHLDLVVGAADNAAELDKLLAVAATNPTVGNIAPAPAAATDPSAREFLTVTAPAADTNAAAAAAATPTP